MTAREPQYMTWKRRGAERVRRLVEGMSREEELAFWRKRTEEMRARQSARQSESDQSDTQGERPVSRLVAGDSPRRSESEIAVPEPECVAIKRRGQEHVLRLVEGMSREEELEFWRKRTEEMRARQSAKRTESGQTATANHTTWPVLLTAPASSVLSPSSAAAEAALPPRPRQICRYS